MATDIVSSVTNVMPGFNGGSMMAVVWIFVLLILALLAWYFSRPYITPIQVNIRRKVGGGFGYIRGNATIKQQDGNKVLYVNELKQSWPLPPSDKMFPMRGFFKKYVYYAYLDENGSLVPEDFDNTQYKSTPQSQDLQAWAQQQRKRVDQNYSDFWNKYGILIGEGVLVVALIITTIIIANKNVEAAKVLGGYIERIATIAQAGV